MSFTDFSGSPMKESMEVSTQDGTIIWSPGELPTGDNHAVAEISKPRKGPYDGHFGLPPGLPWNEAHWRKSTFLHLVRTIWPSAKIIRDDVPSDDPPDGAIS